MIKIKVRRKKAVHGAIVAILNAGDEVLILKRAPVNGVCRVAN